ncbi:MAG: tyrosine-type recombinase/integrase [Firmicutes bacterium]|nr:tyrosine-type recombinase/integrase [Bacillota bacterium]
MAKAWIYKQVTRQGKQLGYYVVYDVGIRPDGRRDRRKKMGFKTKKEAEHWKAQYEAELQRGIVPSRRTRMTVRDYLQYWYEHHVIPSTSAKTEEGYRSVIRGHIIPAMGSVYLQDLTTGHIQRYVYDAIADGKARNTIRNHLAVLRRALNDAVADGMLPRNVVDMRRLSLPKAQSSPHTIWTREQRDAFLAALQDTQYYALVYLAMHTGMRRGELLGLTWRKIDLNRSEILVNTARTTVAADIRQRKPGQGTKTGRYRIIPIIDSLETVLQHHHEHLKQLGISTTEEDYVFLSYHSGRPLSQSEVTRVLNRTQQALGLPHIRFHDLRHLFATLALQHNIPIADVSAILGHSRTSVTLDVYTHVLQNTHREKMEQITAAISG